MALTSSLWGYGPRVIYHAPQGKVNERMEMTPALALDLTRFQTVNSKVLPDNADQADIETATQEALSLVRTHIGPIADYFANRLNGAQLSVKTARINFHFEDKAEVAEVFRMAVLQVVDEARARMAAYGVVNLLLHDLRYPSAFDKEDDHITGMLILAHGIDAYRHAVASEFLQMARDQRARSMRKKLAIAGTVLVTVVAILWLALS